MFSTELHELISKTIKYSINSKNALKLNEKATNINKLKIKDYLSLRPLDYTITLLMVVCQYNHLAYCVMFTYRV